MIYESTFLFVYCSVLMFIIGTVFGSFLNCVAGRIATGRDWIKERSVCDECGHVLEPLDLIPVVSFLLSKGRCRYCGCKLDPQYLYAEIVFGVLSVGLLHVFDLSIQTLVYFILGCCLYCLSLVDLKIYEIPDGCIIISILAWIPYAIVTDSWKSGLLGGFVIAGFVLVISLIMDKVLKKESLGGGDIKLLFVTGLYLGLAGNLFCLILACVIGLGFVVVLKSDKIPFGPAISISAWIMLLFGYYFVNWYLGMFLGL